MSFSKPFLTKDKEPDLTQRKFAPLTFEPVSDDELRKVLKLAPEGEVPEGYVAGWASTTDLDHYRHVVMAGAFDESIREKGLEGPKGIRLLIQHDRNRVAGNITVLENRSGNLWIEAQMNLKIGYVRDFYEAAKMTGGLNFSVGFFLEEYEFKQDDRDIEYLQINKGELEEVSMVTFPGNENAQMTYIKCGPDETPPTFETLAEFEKALVAEAYAANSRNDAARLTRVIKHNAGLFQPKVPPRLADDTKQLDELSDNIKKLRELFADTDEE